MSARRKQDQAPPTLAELRQQVAELQRQAGALSTLVLDQQGRIKALSAVNACLLALAVERTDAPAPMLQAIRGLFGIFGAGLAAMPGTAPAVAAASAAQLEEVLRLAELWIESRSTTPHVNSPAMTATAAAATDANIVPMSSGTTQGREKS